MRARWWYNDKCMRNAIRIAIGQEYERNLQNLLAVGAACGLLCGIDSGVVAGGLPYLRVAERFSDTILSLVAGGMTGGVLISMLAGGWLADRMGRLRMIFFGAILHLLGAAVVQIEGASPAGFVCGRIIQGCGIGFVSVTTPVFLAETFQTSCRGRGVTVFQLSMTVGIVVGAIMSWMAVFCIGAPNLIATDSARVGWRVVFATSAVLSFILLILLHRRARYLNIGNHASCDDTACPRLLTWNGLRPFLLAILVGVGVSLTGVGLVFDFSVLLLERVWISGMGANLVDFLAKVVNLGATILAMLLVDRVGRRPLLFVGLGGCAAAMFGIGLCNWAAERFALSGSVIVGVAVAALFIMLIMFFAIGPGVVSWLILAEIMPKAFRMRGMAIGSVANCAGAFVLLTGFFPLLEKWGAMMVFTLVSGVTAGLLLVFCWLLPETRKVEM